MNRTTLLALLALLALIASGLLATTEVSASAQKMNYLGQIIDMTELIPPPPPRDSEAQQQDLLGVMEVQENRTPHRSSVQSTITSCRSIASTTCSDQSSKKKICP